MPKYQLCQQSNGRQGCRLEGSTDCRPCTSDQKTLLLGGPEMPWMPYASIAVLVLIAVFIGYHGVQYIKSMASHGGHDHGDHAPKEKP